MGLPFLLLLLFISAWYSDLFITSLLITFDYGNMRKIPHIFIRKYEEA